MNREIRARIGTARLLLATLDGAGHLAASKTQSTALLACIRLHHNELSVEELASLQIMAADVPWAENHKDVVLQALSPAEEGSKQGRHAMQNYQAIIDYFTAEEWNVMMDPKASSLVKQDVVLSRACKLGLRAPAEQTLKWFASFLLVLTEPAEALTAMSSTTKHNFMKFLKGAFKTWTRRTSEPVVFITLLPAAPRSLQEAQPQLYDAAYKCGGCPTSCKIDVKLITSVDVSFRCRESATAVNISSQPPASFEMQGIAKFAGVMMQSILGMQQNQQQMMMFMNGTGSSSNGRGKPLQSLEALAEDASLGGCQLRLASAPRALQDFQGQAAHSSVLALSTGRELLHTADPSSERKSMSEAPAAPPAQMPLLAVLASESSVPPRLESTQPPVAAAQSSCEDPTAVSLLALLETRDAERKDARTKGKAAVKDPAAEVEDARTKGKAEVKDPAAAVKTPVLKRPAAAPKQAVNKKQKLPPSKAEAPSWSVEHSRMQVMCRTGLGGPGSTKAIKFGPGLQHRSQASAVTAAKAWLASYKG